MDHMTTAECIHVFENSRLQSESFTPEAVAAAYVAGLEAMQEKAERENPEPLTKEALYRLDEEAIWCIEINIPVSIGFYGILDVEPESEVEPGGERRFWCYNPVYYNESLDYSGYGKEWVAYRHKPKEGRQ